MQRWTLPQNYFGEEYCEYYVLYSQTRDSDTLTRSNFECMIDDLGGESETVIIQRSNHWAYGWVDLILIHESDQEAIGKGNEYLEALENYPVINDMHYSRLEFEENTEIWQTCLRMSEKIALCKEAGASIFAARSKEIPADLHDYI